MFRITDNLRDEMDNSNECETSLINMRIWSQKRIKNSAVAWKISI